jgi:MSHA biogenesis protein MshP
MMKLQKGFSLVSAIFLLVVLAFLGAAMVTFSTNQNQSAAMDVMGSRAYQAARAGMEWGAYGVLRGGGACAVLTNLPPGTLAGTLSGFSVDVTCVLSAASEVNAVAGTVTVYDLTSTATQGGAPGSPDYVERRIQVSIAR